MTWTNWPCGADRVVIGAPVLRLNASTFMPPSHDISRVPPQTRPPPHVAVPGSRVSVRGADIPVRSLITTCAEPAWFASVVHVTYSDPKRVPEVPRNFPTVVLLTSTTSISELFAAVFHPSRVKYGPLSWSRCASVIVFRSVPRSYTDNPAGPLTTVRAADALSPDDLRGSTVSVPNPDADTDRVHVGRSMEPSRVSAPTTRSVATAR